ncbi:MAG: phenylalanine--tRNA ligase subunit beta, partial [Flavitalea sp.]
MTISYNWLSEYLPINADPERISKILTSIGLEVESLEPYESIKGGLKGLVIGQVTECAQHPNADKLKLTTVDIGDGHPLQIVCGAPNVAIGQKVIVAVTGATIYPVKGEPVTMKAAKIRGVESFGMICAEDEIGIGESHEGIIVLPGNVLTGSAAADYYQPYHDWIYEIGLTPNRMDAMSHLGVARDVCAYLSHHDGNEYIVKSPLYHLVPATAYTLPFSVTIENTASCKRYSGVSIAHIQVAPSPKWLQDKLRAIGQRPINNIVDITNYILHDTGQPLHAFDADQVAARKIIVKNLPDQTPFITLDEKERKLSGEDLMICDGNGEGLCIAGVFGGAKSGVKAGTVNIFLESAWFNPIDIRKTSFRHGLRTDAAARFEKNVDISNTVSVLKRAAAMIAEIAGGAIASDVTDIYPVPDQRTAITLRYQYVNKLSGKNYPAHTIKKILLSLGFDVLSEGPDDIRLSVPFSKPDVLLPADVVEEIMRIDGYDNIAIPAAITISPSVEGRNHSQAYKEKIASYLTGLGFNEIFTNSITNAAYFDQGQLDTAVRLLNNLSAVHNIMRPSMLQTGLESIAYNLNRKNQDLQFFEFGKTYHTPGPGIYEEPEKLCLYITGAKSGVSWKGKAVRSDVYYLKGAVNGLLSLLGLSQLEWTVSPEAGL